MKDNLTIKLPQYLHPKEIETLIRIGRDNDGGYVVDERSVQSSDVLLGFGICDDWSFEEKFKSLRSVPVYTFDASVNERFFFRSIIKAIPRVDKLNNLFKLMKTYCSYKKFFKGNNHHITKFVGMDAPPNYLSLSTVMNSILPEGMDNVFIKVDIEGWEYRVLEELIEISDKLTGLVIEFHDVDLHMDKIKRFVDRFPLNICHIHGNNFSQLTGESLPLAMEVTFTKFDVSSHYVRELPNELDMPNSPDKRDYLVTFI